ncbi:hypothetical protein RvY_18712 [Ramazzottius varieornatus]|uniref:Uncharacterized protein n=1 Tax=Ramazzottius varieornatus TaxID=947166 RepID=A0A1D1W711_RAMVA|nr:hypothetical protein RvY_18712 [Ramazzottius varieornatus]
MKHSLLIKAADHVHEGPQIHPIRRSDEILYTSLHVVPIHAELQTLPTPGLTAGTSNKPTKLNGMILDWAFK